LLPIWPLPNFNCIWSYQVFLIWFETQVARKINQNIEESHEQAEEGDPCDDEVLFVLNLLWPECFSYFGYEVKY